MDDELVLMLVLDMLKRPTARDQQKLIGASEIGNPCDYCVARRLSHAETAENIYWLGAKLGTDMHAGLELVALENNEKAESYHFEPLVGAKIEKKIVLGTIEGYGTIKSSPDLVLTQYNHLLDYKSSKRDKIKEYKIKGIPRQYFYQQQLYAWGLNNAGIKVDRISLCFVARDGVGDNDVWIYSFDYDEKEALRAWDRLETIWAWIQAGNDIEEISSHPDCFQCTRIFRRI